MDKAMDEAQKQLTDKVTDIPHFLDEVGMLIGQNFATIIVIAMLVWLNWERIPRPWKKVATDDGSPGNGHVAWTAVLRILGEIKAQIEALQAHVLDHQKDDETRFSAIEKRMDLNEQLQKAYNEGRKAGALDPGESQLWRTQ